MGAPAHSFEIGNLPDGEGVLILLVQAWGKPEEEDFLSQPLEELTVTHGICCTALKFIRVSAAKSVLCCADCQLRVSLPSTLKTLSDLKGFLATRA